MRRVDEVRREGRGMVLSCFGFFFFFFFFFFQMLNLFPHLTVLENCTLAADLGGKGPKKGTPKPRR